MKLVPLITLFFFHCSVSLTQVPNSWTKKSTFGGLKRDKAVAFSIGNYGYVGTGEDTANVIHNDFWKYNPENDVWSQIADLPGSVRRNAVAFTIDSLGYVGTGMDSAEASVGNYLKDFWAYSPVTNTWSQIADYPGSFGLGVYYAAAFSSGTKGFVTCGKYGPNQYAMDLWEYNPMTDNWLPKANFPGGVRNGLSALFVEGHAYVGLGEDQDVFRKDWWKYNPATNLWTECEDFPGSERGQASTFVLGSRGFVVFGGDGGYSDELWEYNPFHDSWSIRANFPGGERHNAIAFSIGERGYAGIGKGPTGRRQNFYEYTPLQPLGNDVYHLTPFTLDIYPNPSHSGVNIALNGDAQTYDIQIYNLNGVLVLANQPDSNNIVIQRGELQEGVYIVYVLVEDTIIQTAKIVVL